MDLEEAAAASDPAFAVSGAAMSNIPQRRFENLLDGFTVSFLRLARVVKAIG